MVSRWKEQQSEKVNQTLSEIETELARFPASVVQELRQVAPQVRERLPADEFCTWAQDGVELAGHCFRSWEAAIEYFRASPKVLQALAFPYLRQWLRAGLILAEESPAISSAYFKASYEALTALWPHQMESWARLGKTLYKGTWRSGLLSSRFFEVSPRLLPYLSLDDLEAFVVLLDRLAERSYESALECLAMSTEVLGNLDRGQRRQFIELVSVLVEANWMDARACFETGPKVLSRIERGEGGRFLALATRVARDYPRDILSLFIDCSRALSRADRALHSPLLKLAEELLSVSCPTAIAFLKSSPAVLAKLKSTDLERWYVEGVAVLRENEEAGVAYFCLESAKCQEVLERLCCGVELDRVRDILRIYAKALTGKDIQILPIESLTHRGIGWTSSEKPSTEGTSVYLPPFVERFASKQDNFGWYKVVVTHQSAHVEFGSFGFGFDKPATLFADLRPELARLAGKDGGVTDLERFFDLFADRKLAYDIFTVVEDTRVDYLVKREYRGLRFTYERIQADARSRRRLYASLPLKEALLEILVRISLGGTAGVTLPPDAFYPLRQAIQVLRAVESPQATVEDSAEATIRLYIILSEVPNRPFATDDGEMLDLAETTEVSDEDFLLRLDVAGQSRRGMPRQVDEGELLSYQSPESVEYRGEFKPELVQLLTKLRLDELHKGAPGASPISREALEKLIEKSAEIEITDLAPSEIVAGMGLFISDLVNQAGPLKVIGDMPVRKRVAEGEGKEEAAAPLEREAQSFLYDEWDFRVNDYRTRWCRVRQKPLEEGTLDFYDKTLETYSRLASQIKRQFEMLTPQAFRKMKRLPDGEDIDFDAVVDSLVDKIMGQSPSEKVYWRRNKVIRDIAVVFLLDMSASTAEAIDEEKKKPQDDWPFDDPRLYLTWLRFQRNLDASGKQYKRIIDIEKESTVLLIRALETIGDAYAIYGFSGYGRDNVELYVVKDLEESFSDHIKRRIDKITPMHATRMGPAIRHCISKLEGREAKTKILFLISDGRPQDHGYSRDGVEKDYAIHDTRMALVEAKRKNITPFCLTVDKAGHDYLKTMCGDIGYEVVADIDSLPKRLPALYRQLTL